MLRSALLRAFYFAVFVVLNVLRIISSAVSAAHRRVQVLYASHNRIKTWLRDTEVQTPNHVALSGAIASEMQAVWESALALISRGTRHITLHDPNHKIDALQLEQLVQASHKSLLCTVRQIASKCTLQSVCRSASNSSVHQVEGVAGSIAIRTCNEERGVEHDEVVVTIVEGRSGQSLLTRAARTLANSADIETSLLSAETVTEWLDADTANCMLPSEPDVVLVFPKSCSSCVPTLDGFPVWQLRLSQIVFATQPINNLKLQHLLQLVTKASSAPKRFGR